MEMINGSILIVDDDKDVLQTARIFLKQKFTRVETLERPESIESFLSENDADVVLLDMNFGKGELDGRTGKEWLHKIKSINPDITVILITAFGDVNLAVESMKLGASDFIMKPWKNEKLFGTIMSALELKRSRSELKRMKAVQEKIAHEIDLSFAEIIGQSPVMRQMYSMIEKVADTDANVLILGENGTGKELVARALHRLSARSGEVFIRVDLGALTGTLFESELFGHVKGAYTDAVTDRTGSFELAQGGTIFLDEIGNISLPLQSKLLNVIQNREIVKVGSNRVIPVDIRLICATNMGLIKMADKEKPEFRKDLLFRINTVEIQVPPLRERTEDIPILVEYFLKIYGKKYNKPGLKPGRGQLKKMRSYSWPGNVRELQHVIEKAVILSEGKVLPDMVFYGMTEEPGAAPDLTGTLEEMERKMIEKSVMVNKGNLTRVATQLGITRATLYRKMEKYDI